MKTAVLACIPAEMAGRLHIVRLSNGEGDWLMLILLYSRENIARIKFDKNHSNQL